LKFGVIKMEQTSNKRRNFMVAFGLGALGLVSAVLMGKRPVVATKTEATAAEPQAVKGYHASEHVKRYYRTTRV
jgi:hypothetical protein